MTPPKTQLTKCPHCAAGMCDEHMRVIHDGSGGPIYADRPKPPEAPKYHSKSEMRRLEAQVREHDDGRCCENGYFGTQHACMKADDSKPEKPSECICSEINARHCPVHQEPIEARIAELELQLSSANAELEQLKELNTINVVRVAELEAERTSWENKAAINSYGQDELRERAEAAERMFKLKQDDWIQVCHELDAASQRIGELQITCGDLTDRLDAWREQAASLRAIISMLNTSEDRLGKAAQSAYVSHVPGPAKTNGMQKEGAEVSQPKVSLIVTSYRPSARPYLDLCIESAKNLDYPKDKLEIIVVSPKSYAPAYDGVRTVSPPEEDYYNSRALNFGVDCASPDSEFFLMVNDDVILTKQSLTALVASAEAVGRVGVFMPIGNDWNAGRYLLQVGQTHGQYRLRDWLPIKDQLMNNQSIYPFGLILAETLCLYAVLIPRSVFNAVGRFNETRKGHDDTDFTLRVRKAGLINAICLSSLVYHFGGVTADTTMSNSDREESLASFKKEWDEKA